MYRAMPLYSLTAFPLLFPAGSVNTGKHSTGVCETLLLPPCLRSYPFLLYRHSSQGCLLKGVHVPDPGVCMGTGKFLNYSIMVGCKVVLVWDNYHMPSLARKSRVFKMHLEFQANGEKGKCLKVCTSQSRIRNRGKFQKWHGLHKLICKHLEVWVMQYICSVHCVPGTDLATGAVRAAAVKELTKGQEIWAVTEWLVNSGDRCIIEAYHRPGGPGNAPWRQQQLSWDF